MGSTQALSEYLRKATFVVGPKVWNRGYMLRIAGSLLWRNPIKQEDKGAFWQETISLYAKARGRGATDGFVREWLVLDLAGRSKLDPAMVVKLLSTPTSYGGFGHVQWEPNFDDPWMLESEVTSEKAGLVGVDNRSVVITKLAALKTKWGLPGRVADVAKFLEKRYFPGDVSVVWKAVRPKKLQTTKNNERILKSGEVRGFGIEQLIKLRPSGLRYRKQYDSKLLKAWAEWDLRESHTNIRLWTKLLLRKVPGYYSKLSQRMQRDLLFGNYEKVMPTGMYVDDSILSMLGGMARTLLERELMYSASKLAAGWETRVLTRTYLRLRQTFLNVAGLEGTRRFLGP
jgi:hypothetical protein